jgi:hypothetical protein
MAFEAPEHKHFEEPLRSPLLSEKADKELDKMVDSGQASSGQAWRKITRKYGTVPPPEPKGPDVEDDVITAAPPKPGESDEQIRQRHRDALRAREANIPSDQSEQSLVQ